MRGFPRPGCAGDRPVTPSNITIRAGLLGRGCGARCDARTPPDSPTESLGRLQPQLLPQMPEPRRVHRAGIEHKLAQGGETRFGQEGGVADPSRPDLDQTAIEHRQGSWGQLGLALLRAGFPAPEEDAVGDVRWGAEVDTEFLAQPGAFGRGEGQGRGALAHRREERPNRPGQQGFFGPSRVLLARGRGQAREGAPWSEAAGSLISPRTMPPWSRAARARTTSRSRRAARPPAAANASSPAAAGRAARPGYQPPARRPRGLGPSSERPPCRDAPPDLP